MKALAIDSAASCITIAARNEEHTVTVSLNIGMKQSEKILPTIEYVLKQAELKAEDLDCTILCSGPGSFTGLRLAFSALKALELAHGTPVYGIPTLDAYAYPFHKFSGTLLSALDAKKDCFYAQIMTGGKKISGPDDIEPADLAKKLDPKTPVLVCGPDSALLIDMLHAEVPSLQLTALDAPLSAADALFALAAEKISSGEEPLREYDGPVYIRKSEAEEMLISRKATL